MTEYSTRMDATAKSIPRPTLTSLPLETLVLVGSYLDKTSLIELSRVSLSLSFIADDRIIWRDLHLGLPRYYGMQPIPFGEGYHPDMEASNVSDAHAAALRGQVKDVLLKATPERWAMVREMIMRPRPAAICPMLLVLEYVAPNLRKLVVDCGTLNPVQRGKDAVTFEPVALDVKEVYLLPSLSALTHLRINTISSADGNFLRRLVMTALALVTLEVDFDRTVTTPSAEPYHESHPQTRLRHLRFSWSQRAGQEDYLASGIVAYIMDASPDMRSANIQFGPDEPGLTWSDLIDAVTNGKKLRDLRWPNSGIDDAADLDGLRRLVLGSHRWIEAFEFFGSMDQLEMVYFDQSSYDYHLPRPFIYPDTFPSAKNFPTFAACLRSHPRLRILHTLPLSTEVEDIALFDRLDDMEASGLVSKNVTSMVHGDDEVVILTFHGQWELVSEGITYEEMETQLLFGYTSRTYASDGQVLCDMFRPLSMPRRWTLTDYQGLAVPEEVIQSMREVEIGVEDWGRRGVVVGDEAWAVLEEWYHDSTTEVGSAP